MKFPFIQEQLAASRLRPPARCWRSAARATTPGGIGRPARRRIGGRNWRKIQAIHEEPPRLRQPAGLSGPAGPRRECLREHGGQGDATAGNTGQAEEEVRAAHDRQRPRPAGGR